ncbi:MAG: hypothetical protein HN348_27175, partial [Proteobacteria bacterium]|nr:hypothetical protein [Pseudomonadota bacterium]
MEFGVVFLTFLVVALALALLAAFALFEVQQMIMAYRHGTWYALQERFDLKNEGGKLVGTVDGVSVLSASSTVNALCSEEVDGVPLCNIIDSYGSIISLEEHPDTGFEGWKFGFPIENEMSDTVDDPDYPTVS